MNGCGICGEFEDLFRWMTLEVKKMSPKEKAEFRNGWIQAVEKRMVTPEVGSEVLVHQMNGKVVKGQVVAVFDSVSGPRIKVVSGSLVLTVGKLQIELVGREQK